MNNKHQATKKSNPPPPSGPICKEERLAKRDKSRLSVSKRKKEKVREIASKLRNGHTYIGQPAGVLTQAALSYPSSPLQSTLTQQYKDVKREEKKEGRFIPNRFRSQYNWASSYRNERGSPPLSNDPIYGIDGINGNNGIDDDDDGDKDDNSVTVIATTKNSSPPKKKTKKTNKMKYIDESEDEESSGDSVAIEATIITPKQQKRNDMQKNTYTKQPTGCANCHFCFGRTIDCHERLFGRYCYERCKVLIKGNGDRVTLREVEERYLESYRRSYEMHELKEHGNVVDANSLDLDDIRRCMAHTSFNDVMQMYVREVEAAATNAILLKQERSIFYIGERVEEDGEV